jgi:hypothetical protein
MVQMLASSICAEYFPWSAKRLTWRDCAEPPELPSRCPDISVLICFDFRSLQIERLLPRRKSTGLMSGLMDSFCGLLEAKTPPLISPQPVAAVAEGVASEPFLPSGDQGHKMGFAIPY